MTPEEKLNSLLEDYGRGGKAKLAKFLKVPPVYVTRWVTDDKYHIPRDMIIKIENFFNLPDGYFLSDKGKPKVRTIPLIGLASCGIPQEYDLDGYEPIPVSEDIYEDGMYAVKAEGDSMSPKINNGSIVYCNVNRQIDNGNIVHYSLNGESGIKRYKINDRGDIISLVPINSDYDIITVHADDNVNLKMSRVIGSVDMDYWLLWYAFDSTSISYSIKGVSFIMTLISLAIILSSRFLYTMSSAISEAI